MLPPVALRAEELQIREFVAATCSAVTYVVYVSADDAPAFVA